VLPGPQSALNHATAHTRGRWKQCQNDQTYMNNIAVFLTIFIFLFSCSDIRKSNIESTVKNDSVISEDEDYSVYNKTVDTLISKKCDFNTLLDIRKNLENLNKSQIRDLLFAIDTSCVNDVEFGEFSNELLFMEKEPELFISEFQENVSKIDTGYILLELSRPINDGIAIKQLLEKVENANIDNATKHRIIKILKKVE
jgi:hypothetical protein